MGEGKIRYSKLGSISEVRPKREIIIETCSDNASTSFRIQFQPFDPFGAWEAGLRQQRGSARVKTDRRVEEPIGSKPTRGEHKIAITTVIEIIEKFSKITISFELVEQHNCFERAVAEIEAITVISTLWVEVEQRGVGVIHT